MRIRNVSTTAQVIPHDGGIAVGVNATVDVPAEVGQELVASGPFKPVRATIPKPRKAKPRS